MSTLKATNLQHNSAVDPNIVLTNSGEVNFNSSIHVASGVTLDGYQYVPSFDGSGTTIQNLVQASGTAFTPISVSGNSYLQNFRSTVNANNVDLRQTTHFCCSENLNANNVDACFGIQFNSAFYRSIADRDPNHNQDIRAIQITSRPYTGSGTGTHWGIYQNPGCPSYFGGGIQFSENHSTGGTQEQLQLDYYEEGEWTPIFGSTSGGGSNPTCTYAANGQQGVYTRIGDTVIASCVLILTNVTGGAGVLDVKGLPFSVGQFPINIAGHGTGGATVNSYSNITQANASYPAVTHIRPRTAAAFQPMSSNGQDTITIGVNRLQNTSVLRAQIVYKVA